MLHVDIQETNEDLNFDMCIALSTTFNFPMKTLPQIFIQFILVLCSMFDILSFNFPFGYPQSIIYRIVINFS